MSNVTCTLIFCATKGNVHFGLDSLGEHSTSSLIGWLHAVYTCTLIFCAKLRGIVHFSLDSFKGTIGLVAWLATF